MTLKKIENNLIVLIQSHISCEYVVKMLSPWFGYFRAFWLFLEGASCANCVPLFMVAVQGQAALVIYSTVGVTHITEGA